MYKFNKIWYNNSWILKEGKTLKEINKEGMLLLVECEDCKQKFEIGENDKVKAAKVTHKKEFNVNGKSIYLTYYDCPSCGRRHFVQIDDKVSLSKLKDVNTMFVKLSIAKRRGKEIPEKQLVKFKKARQHLSDYRIKLMKEFTDKSIHDDEADSNFVLKFSI